MLYADVILPLPLGTTFTYALPDAFAEQVQIGCRLNVPFGKSKRYSGIVTRIHQDRPEGYEVKDALELLDASPILLPQQLKLWQWIADYYLCTLGEVYKAALPSGLKEEDEKKTYKPRTTTCVRLTQGLLSLEQLEETRLQLQHGRSSKQLQLWDAYVSKSGVKAAIRLSNPQLLLEINKSDLLEETGITPSVFTALVEKGFFEVYERQVGRLPQGEIPTELVLRPLSEPQQKAFQQINNSWERHDVCLLHGVTSSGKTEVYIHLINEVISQHKQVLYLLPEIVLTTQLVDRLKRVFGNRLGVYHSKYSDAERVEIWQKQLSDEPYDIIVGVRSSVFLPYKNLGLVIIDEEHENSFKQQDPAPRYHARNAALVLSRMMKAKTLLGTATPSLETYYNCKAGKYALVRLTERYQQVLLPEIEVVDIKEERRKKMMNGPFTSVLLAKMQQALAQGEQVILFQNRRGYAPTVECHDCGWVPRCPHCDVSLTSHLGQGVMTCHYCGYHSPIPQQCPACNGHELLSQGYGTERVEDYIQALFPKTKVARMDLDTTRSRTAYEKIIADFQRGTTQILVGTQMVTKGLDFGRVSVVGILDADTMLNQPDFRSYEHAFQMMSQVSGRAGRRNKQGYVVLQTKVPELPVISQVVTNDYDALYENALEERVAFNFPPQCRLVYVYMKHRHEEIINRLSVDFASVMRRVFGDRVMGPETPPIGRIQSLHIRKIVLKIELNASLPDVRSRLRQISDYFQGLSDYKSASIYYDVDPV